MNLTNGMAVRILPGARPSRDLAVGTVVGSSAVWLRDNVGAVVTVDLSEPDSDGDVLVCAERGHRYYVLPQYLGPIDATHLDDVRAGMLGEEEPATAPPAPTYADRVQALKDAVATFANARGYHDGLSPEKALAVASFLLGEAPR